MNEKQYIECAKIINTHGCRGGIKLESWCNTPAELVALSRLFLKKEGCFVECKIKKASVFKQFVVAELVGIEDMDQALLLKNQVCYAKREDFHLEDGEYFIADLVGLPVLDADTAQKYGRVKELINRGASDLYVVQTDHGEVMIPAVPAFVDHVDMAEGVFVRPIDGMFDAEDA